MDKKNESKELVKQFEGTPFTGRELEDGNVIITCGKFLATRRRFYGWEEATEYVNSTDWDMVSVLVKSIVDYEREVHMEKVETKIEGYDVIQDR